jgi:hypothetical protein
MIWFYGIITRVLLVTMKEDGIGLLTSHLIISRLFFYIFVLRDGIP